MPSKLPDGSFIIAAGEIAEFTVCPRAWHLRQQQTRVESTTEESLVGKQSHASWAAKTDDLFLIASRAKLVIGLTLVVLFVWEANRWLSKAMLLKSGLLIEIVAVVALLVSLLVVLFYLNRRLFAQRKSVGITNESRVLAIDGSEVRETREYVSERLKLAGRPDAVITEAGIQLPVEYKPSAKKIRDRYVAQLLVYMRLLEEAHGVRPPYGYLVLGPSAKRVRIENSPEQQQWLQSNLDIMRAVLSESMQSPTRPQAQKCARCTVRALCPDALPFLDPFHP